MTEKYYPKEGETIFIDGPTGDGGYRAHARDDSGMCGKGVIRPCEEGKPLPPGSLVFTPRCAAPGTMQITNTFYVSGPAQVATPAYRTGWDAIFGAKRDAAVN